MLKAQLGDSSHLPPQPPQQVLQSVDTAEMTAGRDFSPFSAGSGGCHHFEMIWEYKGSRALWERGLPPTTLGVHACSTAKGGWSWHNGRHRELEGVTQPWALRPSLLHSFSICLIQSSRGLSEGWGLNKYLHLFQVGRKKKVDHNDSLQVCTTQGVRHKFTCGKQAIHRCNPRNTRVIKSLIYAR